MEQKIDLAISDHVFRLATNKPDAVRKQRSTWIKREREGKTRPKGCLYLELMLPVSAVQLYKHTMTGSFATETIQIEFDFLSKGLCSKCRIDPMILCPRVSSFNPWNKYNEHST